MYLVKLNMKTLLLLKKNNLEVRDKTQGGPLPVVKDIF